jgi:heme/copper-type cytochrome/quinol oxidase subunit 4
MKTIIKVLVALFLGLGLAQLADLAFYLMNQSDSYLFNIGIILFGIILIAFGYLGLYLVNVLDSKEGVKQNKKEN